MGRCSCGCSLWNRSLRLRLGRCELPQTTLGSIPIYAGKIAQKGEAFDGQHEPIIDGAAWLKRR